jgi:hypothetical protein
LIQHLQHLQHLHKMLVILTARLPVVSQVVARKMKLKTIAMVSQRKLF